MAHSRIVRKKKRWGRSYEYTPVSRNIVVSPEVMKAIDAEFTKTNAITAESLAIKHNLRVSLCKRILEDKVKKGKLNRLHKGKMTTIYGN